MALAALQPHLDAALAHADAFRWQRRVTPLSDERLLAAVPLGYVAGVLALRAALRGRTLPLGPLPALHNLVLTLWSLAMFLGTAHEALRVSAADGAEWLLCLPPGTVVAGRLYWWSYVYYVSKARVKPNNVSATLG